MTILQTSNKLKSKRLRKNRYRESIAKFKMIYRGKIYAETKRFSINGEDYLCLFLGPKSTQAALNAK